MEIKGINTAYKMEIKRSGTHGVSIIIGDIFTKSMGIVIDINDFKNALKVENI